MTNITNAQLADVLVSQCDGSTRTESKKIVQGFVAELGRRGWIHRWRDIEREIGGAWKRKYGVSNVTVVTAHPMTATLRKEIEALAPGADIVERVDERLMGGGVIRIDDRRIDASVAGALQRLKQCLENSL